MDTEDVAKHQATHMDVQTRFDEKETTNTVVLTKEKLCWLILKMATDISALSCILVSQGV